MTTLREHLEAIRDHYDDGLASRGYAYEHAVAALELLDNAPKYVMPGRLIRGRLLADPESGVPDPEPTA